MKKEYYSNGKLLLSGEYAILDGAMGLALPTSFGQSLTVSPNNFPELHWESIDDKAQLWYSLTLDMEVFSSDELMHNQGHYFKTKGDTIGGILVQILGEAKKLNPYFLQNEGYKASTVLDFPQEWGLGSSSTLINNIASWAGVNPFLLSKNTLGGSGYDIACAGTDVPITYRLENETPKVEKVVFDPPFKKQLFFVYRNQKQNSREGIKTYRNRLKNTNSLITNINQITNSLLSCKELSLFESLLQEHELLIASVLQTKPVKEQLFKDYRGVVKSLGAWGGDFLLVTGTEAYLKGYFNNKGYKTILPYSEMILQKNLS